MFGLVFSSGRGGEGWGRGPAGQVVWQYTLPLGSTALAEAISCQGGLRRSDRI